jgi:hypothetical protein
MIVFNQSSINSSTTQDLAYHPDITDIVDRFDTAYNLDKLSLKALCALYHFLTKHSVDSEIEETKISKTTVIGILKPVLLTLMSEYAKHQGFIVRSNTGLWLYDVHITDYTAASLIYSELRELLDRLMESYLPDTRCINKETCELLLICSMVVQSEDHSCTYFAEREIDAYDTLVAIRQYVDPEILSIFGDQSTLLPENKATAYAIIDGITVYSCIPVGENKKAFFIQVLDPSGNYLTSFRKFGDMMRHIKRLKLAALKAN